MRFVVGSSLVVLLLACLASPVGAEAFVEAYGAVVFTNDERIDFTDTTNGANPKNATQRPTFDTVGSGGVQAGWWFDRAPGIGLGFDISSFEPESDNSVKADFEVVSLTPLLLLRIPTERVRPYVAIGPGIFIADMKGQLPLLPPPPMGVSNFNGASYDEQEVTVGWDFRAGLNVPVAGPVNLFAEYRLTSFSPDYETRDSGTKFDVQPTIRSHHARVGIGIEFFAATKGAD